MKTIHTEFEIDGWNDDYIHNPYEEDEDAEYFTYFSIGRLEPLSMRKYEDEYSLWWNYDWHTRNYYADKEQLLFFGLFNK